MVLFILLDLILFYVKVEINSISRQEINLITAGFLPLGGDGGLNNIVRLWEVLLSK
jgi:hypothetical protein